MFCDFCWFVSQIFHWGHFHSICVNKQGISQKCLSLTRASLAFIKCSKMLQLQQNNTANVKMSFNNRCVAGIFKSRDFHLFQRDFPWVKVTDTETMLPPAVNRCCVVFVSASHTYRNIKVLKLKWFIKKNTILMSV